MNGFSFSAEQQELCAGVQGSRGSYDSFGREGLHSRESMRSRSSVFTVLDSTQGALEDFAAQVGWQREMAEKPRVRLPFATDSLLNLLKPASH